MTHTDAILAQIIELENEVRNDPRVAAIKHLKAALAALTGVQVASTAEPTSEQSDARPRAWVNVRAPLRANQTARTESKIMRIKGVVERYIDEHGPTHRAILVDVLNKAGLNENVKNPMTAFATSMNTLKEFFVSDGQGTFRRRESEPSEVSSRHHQSPRGDAGGVAPPAASFSEQLDRKRVVETDTEAGGT